MTRTGRFPRCRFPDAADAAQQIVVVSGDVVVPVEAFAVAAALAADERGLAGRRWLSRAPAYSAVATEMIAKLAGIRGAA